MDSHQEPPLSECWGTGEGRGSQAWDHRSAAWKCRCLQSHLFALLRSGRAGRRYSGIGIKLSISDGSRRDPRSLAVGETYGKCQLRDSANPAGVEFDPSRVGASTRTRKGSFLRRFHLRLMMLMPFGHSSCGASASFNAYAIFGRVGPLFLHFSLDKLRDL
jgi:hypothetical protein